MNDNILPGVPYTTLNSDDNNNTKKMTNKDSNSSADDDSDENDESSQAADIVCHHWKSRTSDIKFAGSTSTSLLASQWKVIQGQVWRSQYRHMVLLKGKVEEEG
jgi:hypothetical protein